MESVLDEHLLLGANLELLVILAVADVLELEKFLGPLMTILRQNVLILVDPLVLFEFDLTSVRLTWDLDAPQLLVVNIKMHLRINVWKHLPLVHYIWDDSVVEVLIQQLQLKHLLDGHELGQILQRTI